MYFKEFLRRKLTETILKKQQQLDKKNLRNGLDVGDSVRQRDGPSNFSPSLSALSLMLSKSFIWFLKSKKKKSMEGTKHHLGILWKWTWLLGSWQAGSHEPRCNNLRHHCSSSLFCSSRKLQLLITGLTEGNVCLLSSCPSPQPGILIQSTSDS